MTATFHPSQDFRRSRHEMAITYELSTVVPNYTLRRVAVALVALAVLAAGAVGVGEVVGALADLGGRPAAASEVAPSASTIAGCRARARRSPCPPPSTRSGTPASNIWRRSIRAHMPCSRIK